MANSETAFGRSFCCAMNGKAYSARMQRDTKELLIGSATIMLFGCALVVWPPLGGYIHDAVHALLNPFVSWFKAP